MRYNCKICGQEFDCSIITSFKKHIEIIHQIDFLNYLRQYEPEKGGYCKICKKETPLLSYNEGFSEYCSDKCFKKSQRIEKKKLAEEIKKNEESIEETPVKKTRKRTTKTTEDSKPKKKKTKKE